MTAHDELDRIARRIARMLSRILDSALPDLSLEPLTMDGHQLPMMDNVMVLQSSLRTYRFLVPEDQRQTIYGQMLSDHGCKLCFATGQLHTPKGIVSF